MNEKQRHVAGMRDAAPTNGFRREIENSLVYIVRRTVRTRRANSPLTRRILVETDRLAARDSRISGESLVERVCQSLGQSMMDRMCRGGRDSEMGLETIRN